MLKQCQGHRKRRRNKIVRGRWCLRGEWCQNVWPGMRWQSCCQFDFFCGFANLRTPNFRRTCGTTTPTCPTLTDWQTGEQGPSCQRYFRWTSPLPSKQEPSSPVGPICPVMPPCKPSRPAGSLAQDSSSHASRKGNQLFSQVLAEAPLHATNPSRLRVRSSGG